MSDVDLLRKALSAEHAAVWAYGLVGARTTGTLRARAAAAFDAHRARRDQLRTLITQRGGKPTEAEPSYDVDVPTTATQSARLAAHVEDGITAAYLELTSATDPTLRRYAATAMQESTTRSYAFRPTIPPFPGMPPTPTPTPSPTHPNG
ncbi:ferritin-like domain-containing protein [Nonomuraea sp. NPDC050536]|uniref:ferritin-like domain-containing protein n=1 Tax=Nonomuraea sp. NPDC050536 TaxID=3364366 RepID=UPI0037CB3957